MYSRQQSPNFVSFCNGLHGRKVFMRTRLGHSLLCLLALLLSGCADSMHENDSLLVFAASSLAGALDKVLDDYESRNGVEVRRSYASSGVLAQQIMHGAPADLYFSANIEWMRFLIEQDAVSPESQRIPFGNRLVIVQPASDEPGIQSASELADLGRIAVADLRTAPAGIYARAWLEHSELWAAVSNRIIQAAHVRAALALVERGEADAGIVYQTDTAHLPQLRRYSIEVSDPLLNIRYAVALLKKAPHPLARDLLEYLCSERGLVVFSKHGFLVRTVMENES